MCSSKFHFLFITRKTDNCIGKIPLRRSSNTPRNRQTSVYFYMQISVDRKSLTRGSAFRNILSENHGPEVGNVSSRIARMS